MPMRSDVEVFIKNATRNDLVSKVRTLTNTTRALEEELERQGNELEDALKEKARYRDLVRRVGKAQSHEFSKALRECEEEANG